jgi:glycine hydroxymethyltransferase
LMFSNQDTEIIEILRAEEDRQRSTLELIASENFTSAEVMLAQGSVLTNKYAEGYPGKRYYGGCECVDGAESLAIERLKKLFGCQFANVQSHSGSSANMAAYQALLEPGDRLMGMNLTEGGHLTHGSPVNFSGQHYQVAAYGLGEDERIDYEGLRECALKFRPKMIVAGATAYPRIIDFEKFRRVCDEVGAYLVVDMAHIAGLVAAGEHPSPVGIADVITSTTHKTLRGPRGGFILTDNEGLALRINKVVFPGLQGGPLMHIIAAKAVAFYEALQPSFKDYQRQVIKNAKSLVGALVERGFRAVSGGTDNHLGLIDLSGMKISGKKFEKALEVAGITVNKNTVPQETRSPFITSGIRVGTPALSSRGMREPEMVKIADWMSRVQCHVKDEKVLAEIRTEVEKFARGFSLPWDT